MASTPAPLPSLGLLDGLGAATVPLYPGPLPHLALLGGFSNAGAPASYTLTCGSGAYNLTGSDALRDFYISAVAGTYTFTGANVTLRRGRTLIASGGTYNLTGAAVNLKVARKIAAAAGTYSLTGADVTLTASGSDPVLTAAAGAYTLTGAAASLRVARVLSCAGGSYALTGASLTLDYISGRRLVCEAGVYSLTGADLTITRSATVATTGAYVYIPLRALSGVWTVTGVPDDETNLKAWLPPSRQPIAYQQNGQWLCDPTWYRFFQYVAEIKLGGANGPTLTAVAETAATTAQTAASASTQVSAIAQQTQTNAEALAAVKQVAQDNSLSGAEQIPNVQLSPYEAVP